MTSIQSRHIISALSLPVFLLLMATPALGTFIAHPQVNYDGSYAVHYTGTLSHPLHPHFVLMVEEAPDGTTTQYAEDDPDSNSQTTSFSQSFSAKPGGTYLYLAMVCYGNEVFELTEDTIENCDTDSMESVEVDVRPAVTVSFSAATYTAEEGGSAATVTVKLSDRPGRQVVIPIDASGGGGATPSDYVLSETSLTFGSNEVEKTLEITATNDSAYEYGEFVSLGFGTLPSRVTAGSTTTETVDLIDDDHPQLTISAGPSSVAEGSSATFTVTASLVALKDLTVPIDVSEVGDYIDGTPPSSVTISADSNSTTVTIATDDDTVDEPNGSVTVTVGSGTGFELGSSTSATVDVRDNESSPTVTLRLSPTSISEDGGESSVTASLSHTSSEATTVTVIAEAISPTVAGDFTLSTNKTLAIAAGKTVSTGTVSITAVDNSTDEDEKSVTVSGTASNTQGVTGPESHTLTIEDDDVPELTISAGTLPVTEGGDATYTIAASPVPAVELTVNIGVTQNGSYIEGAAPTSVTLGAGDNSVSFSIDTDDDSVDEANGSVTVELQSGTGYSLGSTSSASVTVTDDDTRGATLSRSSVTVTEASGSGRTATYTVVLDSEPTGTVTVTPTSLDTGVATVSGALTFDANDWSSPQTVTVTGVDNNVDSPDRTTSISHTVTGGDYGNVTAASVSVTLTDDDPSPTVTLSLLPSSVAEGGSSTVTASLSHGSSQATTVTVSSSGPSWAYTQTGSTLTIAAGSTSSTGTVTISATDDSDDDPDRTVTVSGSATNSQGVAGPADRTLTIEDRDPAPTVTLTLSPSSVAEGGSSTVTASLSHGSSQATTVTVSASGREGSYTQSGTMLTIARWQTSSTGTVTIQATDDNLDGPNKSVTVSGTASNSWGVAGDPANRTLTITDNDSTPTATLTLSPSTIGENGETSTVTASLSHPSSEATTLTVSAAPVSPAVAGDFTLSANKTLTIAAGATASTGAVTVTGVNNDVDAADKSVTVSATASGGNGVAAPSNQTLMIEDDDVTVSFSADTYTATEGGTAATVAVNLSESPGRQVEIPLAASGGGGATSSDYSGIPSSLTFASGDTKKTFDVAATDDSEDDDGESVSLSFGALPDGVTAGGRATATVDLADNDDPEVTVSFSSAEYTATEAGTVATVTVNLSADPERSVTVPIEASGGGGAGEGDFALSTSVTFASGETQKTFTVTAEDDDVDDDGESVLLSFGTLPDGVTAGSQATATVNIEDNDDPEVTVSFSAASYTATEGGTAATVTVNLSADPEREVAIPMQASAQGGATAQGVPGADYSGIPQNVTFASGVTVQTFTVTAVDDRVDDDGESVSMGFGMLPDGVTAGTEPTTDVQITDNDIRGVTLNSDELTVAEGGSDTYTVVLHTQPTDDVTVTFSSDNTDVTVSTANANDDLVFTPSNWDSAQTVTVSAVADTDTVNDTATIGHTFRGADYDAFTADSVAVTVKEVDSTPPGLDTAEVNRTSLTLTFDEPLDDTSVPGPGAFTVTVAGSGTSPTVSGVSISGSAVTLTLASAVKYDETATVSYAVPALNPIQDASGNDAGTLNNEAVSNAAEAPAVTVSYSEANYTAEEGGTNATVSVTLSTDAEREVIVPIEATPQGGATAQGEPGADYSGIPESLTFPSGETEQTIVVTATDDDVDDDGEGVRLNFGTLPPAVTAGTQAMATVNITNDDTRGVTVSETDLAVPEGDSATYTVVLDSEPTDAVTVTIGGAAGDVSVDDATLEFTTADWSMAQTVTVSALADTDGVNDAVTLTHTASGGGYDDVSIDSVAVTVDSTPRLQGAAANGTSLVLTYHEPLDGASMPAVSAFTVTVAGAATSPTVSGVSIAGSAVTLTLSPAVGFGDTLTVSYAVPSTDPIQDAAGNDAEALTDQAVTNETPDGVTVEFSADTYTAEEGGTAATVTVTLSAAPGEGVEIPIGAAAQGGATAQGETGEDYSGIPENVTFAGDEKEKTFTVTATDDSVDDDGESVALSFGTLPDGVTTGTRATASVEIADNDTRGVRLSKDTLAIAEGNSGTYTVVLDSEPTADVTVTFASDNEDVTIDTSNADNDLVFTPSNWDTPQTVMVSAAPDEDTIDDTAVITHAVSGGDYTDVAVASLTVNVTVTEVNSTPRLQSAVANRSSLVLTYGEPLDSGSTPATDAFTVTVAGADPSPTVSAVLIAGSAVTLTLSSEVGIGETVTVSYVVPATNPIQDEAGNDAEALTDQAVVNATVVEVTVSFAAATYTVTEDGTAATVTVTLSADPDREVAIPIAAAPQGGATAQGETGADYAGIPENVTFADGQTQRTFTVTAVDDTVDDDGESIALSFGTPLPAGVTATGQTAATVDITDDDVPSWAVTVSPSMIVEAGGTGTVTVSTGEVTFADDRSIDIALGGTATAGTDYTVSADGQVLSAPYSVTLSAGDTSVTATLTGVADSVADSDETITVAASLGGVELATATASIVEGICGRTGAVQDAIVAALGQGVVCGNVTAAQLAGLGSLSVASAGLTSLKTGDFDGLTGITTLDLRSNTLASLPAGVFGGLNSLSILNLKNNRLTAVSAGNFRGLGSLTRLTFENNRLQTLPADLFSGLPALQELNFRKNRLRTLPSGIFSGLSALRDLNFRNNNLSSLPGDVFSGLAALEVLNLRTNELSSLPDGLFSGLTGLTTLRLDGNGNADLSLAVSLEKVGHNGIRAVAPAGAPFAMQLPVSLSSGEIAGGATSITIPVGAIESGTLTVARTAGTLDAVTADLGTLPGLPAAHLGYALAKSADLPVSVLKALPLPEIAIAAVSASVTEGIPAAFTVTRTGPTGASLDVSVQVTETGSVLETASDYASAVTVTIPAQSATATFTVATDDDSTDEALTGSPGVAGRIAAAVQSGTGYATGGSSSATVAVNDNDPLGTAPPASALVSNLAQTGIGSLFVHSTMTLRQGFTTGADAPGYDGFALSSVAVSVLDVPDTPSGVTVSLYSADASGNPDSRLYTLSNPAGFSVGNNTFAVPADTTLDADTTYFVVFEYTGTVRQDFQLDYTRSAAEDAGGEAGWSIADREHGVPGSVLMIGVNGHKTPAPPASLSVTGGRAEEGTDTSIDFAVTLDRTSAESVTVSYKTVDGTAVAGEDYNAASGSLTFASGETSKTVSVTVLDDLVDEDEETFTLLLYDASGAGVSNAQARGTIANSDPLPQAWLVRFGRTVASHVAEGIGERLMQPRSGATEATLAGARLPFGQALSLSQPGAALHRHPGESHLFRDPVRHDGLARYGTTSPEGLRAAPGTASRGLTDLDLLTGSSFLIRLGEDGASGPGWTVWGRGMATHFNGQEDELSLRGDVRTYMIGADTTWKRWLAGVALAHSTGAGGYDAALDAGRSEQGVLESGLTSVHPYARFTINERVSAWGVLGYGAGELALDREGAGIWHTDTVMRMAAAGTRGVLRPSSGGGLELALKTDVLWTGIGSGAAENAAGRLAGSDGAASRLRLILEGSRRLTFAGNRTLTPSMELGLRRDGGDAETGAGVELGGALRFADPARGLSVELKARGLVAHRDADYREWGASAAIKLDPGTTGRGLMLALTPSWGTASGGAERLWSQSGVQSLGDYGGFAPAGRVDAEMGYALTGPRGRGLQTPYAALSQADAGDLTLRMGWRLALSPVSSLDVQGTRRQPATGDAPDHGVQLRMGLRW